MDVRIRRVPTAIVVRSAAIFTATLLAVAAATHVHTSGITA